MEKTNNYRSGYIAVIGKPNVGKSTIINYLLGEKLVIVTPRPQTTRNNTLGILTTDNYQMIFIDTPGIHQPKTLLGKHMVKQARNSLQDSDIIVFVVDAYGITDEDKLVASLLKKLSKPTFLLINKIDLVVKSKLLPLIDTATGLFPFKEIIPTSSTKKQNMDILKEKLIGYLPFGPQYYPPEQLSDKKERFFVTELIREQTLKLIREEIPHSIAVQLEEMKDRSASLSYIKAIIYVERDSQKKIIIGKDGQQLKKIGQSSRIRIEKFLGRKVYLDLWIKVYKNWRKNPKAVKLFTQKS